MPDWLRKLLGLKTKQEEKLELERIAEQRIVRERIARELKARTGKSQLGKLANSQAVYRPSVDGTIRGHRADSVIMDDVATAVAMNAILSEPSSHSSLSSDNYGGSHSASHSCDSSSSSYDSSSSCSDSSSSYSSFD